MKVCKGPCGLPRNFSDYYITRHGNPMRVCRFCKCEYQRTRNAALKLGQQVEHREIKPRVFQSPFIEKIERPCSVFPGYFFAGDL